MVGVTAPAALKLLRLWRDVLLFGAEGDTLAAGATADAMAAALDAMGPEAVPEHRIRAHYDLATFRSGRGGIGVGYQKGGWAGPTSMDTDDAFA